MQLEDYPKIRINNLTIQGHSKSAERTCFYIHEFKIMFDAAISTKIIPKILMITHTHSDHCYNLPKTMYPGVQMTSLCDRKIYVPNEAVLPIKNFINSVRKLENCDITSPEWASKFNIIGIFNNDTYELNGKYIMNVIECFHSIPCVGYGIIEKRMKLKKEYIGQDIQSLKKQNIDVSVETHNYILCYLGDTTINVFESNPKLEEYSIILVECTYLEEDYIQKAKDNSHICWFELKPWINKYQNTKFILIHFSLRYKDSEIKKFFDNEINEMTNKKIYVWLNYEVISYQ